MILAFYAWPSLQLILSTLLTLGFLCYILGRRVINDRQDYYIEVFNEFVVLITCYFLVHFNGEFLTDAVIRQKIGYFKLAFIGTSFLFVFLLLMRQICKQSFSYLKTRKVKKMSAKSTTKVQNLSQDILTSFTGGNSVGTPQKFPDRSSEMEIKEMPMSKKTVVKPNMPIIDGRKKRPRHDDTTTINDGSMISRTRNESCDIIDIPAK